jgi:hypothetical protein
MHGQNETRAMPPLAMPPLVTYEHRLWKQGNVCFCIHPKAIPIDGTKWNESLKHYMEHIRTPPIKVQDGAVVAGCGREEEDDCVMPDQ